MSITQLDELVGCGGRKELLLPYKNPMNCMYPGCPNKVYKGRYCEIHNSISEAKKKYRNTVDWKIEREEFLRDNPYCDCGEVATDVHHGRYGLEAKCHSCHSRITRKEVSR
ncbi:MAG: hypothetical protein PHW73_01700 [Atribacterota bacterium]|nr:hypothetical protein [Atribacterota bacterium]